MDPVRRAAALLKDARRIVVLSGAGMSAESGVPTFRDAFTGLWARHKPEQLATPDAFRRHPALVTRWYDERRGDALKCEPNAAHRALVRWQRLLEEQAGTFTILTQNVDGLHQRAGSTDVVELHGSLFTWRCTHTGEERTDLPIPLPQHPMPSESGGLYRPAIVWFGEMLPDRAMARAFLVLETCDAVVSIGTSAVVYPAAGFVSLAQEWGAKSVEVNLEPTPISDHVDVSILGKAGEMVPRLVDLVIERVSAPQ